MLNLLFLFKMFVNINSEIFYKIFLFNVVDFCITDALSGGADNHKICLFYID